MNILNKIHIHFLTYYVLLISILTGQFKIISFLFFITIIHELGHIFVSQLFKWGINKITLYPFGGSIKYDIKLNEKMFKEFLVTIAGPLFQIIFTYVLLKFNFLSYSEKIYIKNLSYSLLIFNLLPIVPLDGSKLMFLFLNRFFSYYKSHIYLVYISIFFSMLIFIHFLNNLTFQSVLIFLVFSIINEIRNHEYLFNRFLIERFFNKDYMKGRVIVLGDVNAKKIYRERRNIFVSGYKVFFEDYVISKYLNK